MITRRAILLFVAGHDSTVNLISHCVLTVLRNPGSIELLCSRPDLIPGAIEEVLRLQSSVQFFPSRSALADWHNTPACGNPSNISRKNGKSDAMTPRPNVQAANNKPLPVIL